MNALSTSSSEVNVFKKFCQDLFESEYISIRCVAESKKLLSNINDKNKIFKLTPDIGPLDNRIKQAQVFNSKGYAVYYLPQRFKSGFAESYNDIIEYRGVVVDLDNAPIEPVKNFIIPPNIIVETSKGKFQCIWKFNPFISINDLSVDDFNAFAAELGSLFGADLSCAKATQCFRAPGFLHQKGEAYESRIISTVSTAVTYEELKSAARSYNSRGNSGNGNGKHDIHEAGVTVSLDQGRSGAVRVIQSFRHNTLISWARSLANKGLNYAEVLKELRALTLKSFEEGHRFQAGGDRDSEVAQIIKDCFDYKEVEDKEREIKSAALLEESSKLRSSFSYDFSVGTLKVDKYTESAVADRVVQRFSDDFARVGSQVLCYHGEAAIWVPQRDTEYKETKARVLRCIQDTVNEIEFKNKFCRDKRGQIDENKEHSAKAPFYKVNAVNNISKSVLNHIGIPQYSFGDFDRDPKLFYCANGVLDLESGLIRCAKNEDKLLCRSSVAWNQDAECKGWLKFLGEVFAQNEEPQEMIRFMQELFAYSLSGLISEQKLFCYQGDGSNGKSKTLDALRKICGAYHTIIEPEDLTINGNKFQKAFERLGAKVESKRVAVVDDFQMAGSWNEAFVKVLTGPEIRARAEYERSRISPNRVKFHIGMNKAPDPEEENFGILRRLCFIPFPRRFKENPIKSREIDSIIETEASGILGWAQKGFNRVVERGLSYPQETKSALEAYRHETFKVETAVEDMFEVPKNNKDAEWLNLSVLLESVNSYFRASSMNISITSEKLSRALKMLGFEHTRKYNPELKNTTSHFFVKMKKNLVSAGLGVL